MVRQITKSAVTEYSVLEKFWDSQGGDVAHTPPPPHCRPRAESWHDCIQIVVEKQGNQPNPPVVRVAQRKGRAMKMGLCQTAVVGAMTIAAYVSVLRFEATAFLYGGSRTNSPFLLHCRCAAISKRRHRLKGLHSCWARRRAPPCLPPAAVVQHCPSSSNWLPSLVRLSAAGDGGGGEESNALLLRMDFERAKVQELREWIRR